MVYSVKPMISSEFASAYELAWETFTRFQKAHYTEEGAESFYRFLYGGKIEEKYLTGDFVMFGCYCDGVLAGVGGLRDGNHIALMFTKGEYQRMGVGSRLMSRMLRYAKTNGMKYVTLNSSPCGLPFYKAVGFFPTDDEQILDGIIYTPMKYDLC